MLPDVVTIRSGTATSNTPSRPNSVKDVDHKPIPAIVFIFFWLLDGTTVLWWFLYVL